MGKSYNLGNSSDMRRFEKDLKKEIQDKTVEELHSRKYDVTCPSCGASVSVPTGKSRCPRCHEEIDLKLDINF